MKQKNRVQLSLPSLVKIFAIYGFGVSVAVGAFHIAVALVPGVDFGMSAPDIVLSVLASPIVFIVFSIIGFPIFYGVNKLLGGLELTVYRRKTKETSVGSTRE